MSADPCFLFLRHGETDWNASGLFQGRTDIALNSNGVLQAHRAAERMKHLEIGNIVSSPMIRSLETARIIAKALNRTVEVDDRLIECDFGSLEGQSITDAMTRHKITRLEQLADILPEDGERWDDVRKRALAVVDDLMRSPNTAPTVLVGHDAVLQAISEELCSHWFKSGHATPYKFRFRQNQWLRTELA